MFDLDFPAIREIVQETKVKTRRQGLLTVLQARLGLFLRI